MTRSVAPRRAALAAAASSLLVAAASAGAQPMPVAASPACGSELAAVQATLAVDNPAGGPYLFQFQLHDDPALPAPIAQADVAQAAGATTSWTVPLNLTENRRYYWRARARTGAVFGPWMTPACSFKVNILNQPPGVPHLDSPAFGAQVQSLTPTLRVDNSVDLDEDAVRYRFEVFADAALSVLVTASGDVPEGAGGLTAWQVAPPLMEDRFYYWRVRAIDEHDEPGAWSATGQFFATTTNAPPEPPSIVSPQNGTVVTVLRPPLVILNADDSDLDEPVYDWDLALDAHFNDIVASAANEPPVGSQNTSFFLSVDLGEDRRYCWRVRSDDGQATSNYNIACFLVSTRNDPPSVPTLDHPADDGVTSTTTPLFSWAPSIDPEDEAITYEIEVMDATRALIGSVTGISGTVTSISTPMVGGEVYSWRARAIDRSGAWSAWSAENTFVVGAPVEPPDSCCEFDDGCEGCRAGGGGAGGLVALGLALVPLVRRRRRR